jgi:glutaredoxin 3
MTTAPVTIYRTRVCPYCVMATQMFKRLDVAYTEVYLDDKHDLRTELAAKYNWQTVPMIVVGETFVGGYSDVAALERSGKLAELLQGAA